MLPKKIVAHFVALIVAACAIILTFKVWNLIGINFMGWCGGKNELCSPYILSVWETYQIPTVMAALAIVGIFLRWILKPGHALIRLISSYILCLLFLLFLIIAGASFYSWCQGNLYVSSPERCPAHTKASQIEVTTFRCIPRLTFCPN